MEVRRILAEKYYILGVLALLILNFALFQYSQAGTWEILGDDIQREVFLQGLIDKQNEEHEQFYQRINNISDEVDSLLDVSIFADENSIAYKNINKTAEDYKKLKGIELSNTNDYAVESFIRYDGIYIAGIIIILFTVAIFRKERKNGIWELIYVTKNGRRIMCMKRGIMLFIISLITSVILIGGTLSLSFINFGGADLLFAPVQSVGMLQNVVMNISLLEFVVYYCFIYAGCLFVNGLLIWCIMSCIRNINMSMIIVSAIYITEWLVYSVFMWSNPLSILKYSNIYFLSDPREAYTEYTNFSVGNNLINLREYVPFFIILAIAVMMVIHIFISEFVKPVYGVGKVEKLYNNICDFARKKICYMTLGGFEVFKALIHRKGIIVIGIFILVNIVNIDHSMLVISPARELLDEFYDKYTGEIDDEALAAYSEIETKAKAISEEGNAENNAVYNMYKMLKEQLTYGEGLKANGIAPWFINDRGYKLLLNGHSLFKRIVDGMLLVIAVVLISSSVYSDEKKQGLDYLIKSTIKGRKQLFVRKSVVTLVITGVLALFLYGTQMYEVLLQYELDGLGAPIQNIGILNELEYSISVAGFIGIWLLSRMSVMLMVSSIVMYISVRGKNAERVYMTSFLMIPAGIIDAMIINIIQCPHLYIALIPMLVSIMIAGLCLVLTKRVWIGKSYCA